MVQSYGRFEPGAVFGIVSSATAVASLVGAKNQVAVGADEAVNIWNLKSGELVARLADPAVTTTTVSALEYEPQSNILATGYTDGSVRIWDLASRTALITFQGHRSAVSSLAFDEAGVRLISGSVDTTLIVWDLISEQGMVRLRGHKAPITGLALVSDDWLASIARDGVLKLWDLATQFCVETHVAHKEAWALALGATSTVRSATSNGEAGQEAENQDDHSTEGDNAKDEHSVREIVSAGSEIRVWKFDSNAADGSKLSAAYDLDRNSRHRASGLRVNDGWLVTAAGDALHMWRRRTPNEMKRAQRRAEKRRKDNESPVAVPEFVGPAVVRTRGKVAGISLTATTVVANLGSNCIEEFTLSEEEPERRFSVDHPGHRTDVRDVAASSDGKLVASGSNGMIKVHNVLTTKCVRTLEDAGYVLSIKFLPGDALVAAATKEGTLDVYDIAKASKVATVEDAHAGSAVWSLDVAADGRSLVSGGADKTVRFWSLTVSGGELILRNTHKLEFNDDVLAVKLSPDQRLVAASLLDNTVKVYYRDTLKFFLNLYGHQLPVLSLDISSDNKLLVTSSADKNIKIWGLDFGDCHRSLFAHDDSVLRVVFEPGSHNFVSCGKDKLVKWWDGNKFIQIQRMVGHHAEVWALAVTPEYVITASHDKSMRIWELTDEPLFVQEERENELEEAYEEQLVTQLDRDAQPPDDETGEGADIVTKNTVESLKAGERLYEALDIAWQDTQREPHDPRSAVLEVLKVSPERYLMDTLQKISPSQVEDALLTFPLDRIVHLLNFIRIWLERRWNLVLVARVLLFCVRTFHRQLVANKMLGPELDTLRTLLRTALQELADVTGWNIARLAQLKDAWALEHVHGFADDAIEATQGRKREYASLAL